jgi:hypothetical protein
MIHLDAIRRDLHLAASDITAPTLTKVIHDLCAEVERLRGERHIDNEQLARAWDESRDMERAAVVAALRRTSNHGPMGLSLVNLDSIADAIERGEHRKEGT